LKKAVSLQPFPFSKKQNTETLIPKLTADG
jgi:hypothetical protein